MSGMAVIIATRAKIAISFRVMCSDPSCAICASMKSMNFDAQRIRSLSGHHPLSVLPHASAGMDGRVC
jgi:hypothetical protein